MKNSKTLFLLALSCLLAALASSAFADGPPDTINTVAGGGPSGVPAIQANADYPGSTAWDSAGNYYFVSQYQERVYKVSASGTLTLVAGNGTQGYSGDGGPATEAQLELDYYSAVAVDSSGNVYIADTYNSVVRVVNAKTGIISTFAGMPRNYGFSGDGGPATSAQLTYPEGLAVDSSNNVYISDLNAYRIREVSGGTINTVAGNGNFCYGYSNYPCGDGGPATSAQLGNIYSLAVDGANNVFLSDSYYYNQVVRMVTVATGTINTVAGAYSGAGGISPCRQSSTVLCGDNGPATSAGFYYPYGIGSDAQGDLFIADFYNYDVRQVVCADSTIATCNPGGKTAGDIYTIAGTGGSYCYTWPCGDGGPATSAQFTYLYGTLGVDAAGDILIGDYQNLRVREVTGGNVNTVAGNGTFSDYGNGEPATGAELNQPEGVAADSNGNLYIVDTGNCVVRKVDNTGLITLFAGMTGQCGYGGDGGPATAALLSTPRNAAVDAAGNVYISDYYNADVRKVDTSGNISTVVGYHGSPSNPVYYAWGVAVTPDGSKIYASSNGYCLVQQWDGSNLTTVAGLYLSCGFNGDGKGTSHQLYEPAGLALGPDGSLYIADEYNQRIRKLDTSGNLTSVAGNGACFQATDGVPALDSSLCYPLGVGVDAAGDILIADTNFDRIRFVDGGAGGLIHTAAGNGTYGFSGDGGLGTNAELTSPYGLALDPSGNIYFADLNNNRVREIAALPAVNASRYSVDFGVIPVNVMSGAHEVTLSVAGPISALGISTGAPFSEVDNCAGITSGETCDIDIYFKSSTSGTFTGTVQVASNAFFESPLTINLTAAAGALSVAPTSISFGNVSTYTTTKAKNVKLLNKGVGSITLGTASASAGFLVVAPTVSPACGPSGSTLAGGGVNNYCYYGVAAHPTTEGLTNGSLTITDSDGSSPQIVLLSMTGVGDGASVSPTKINFGTAVLDGATTPPKAIKLTYNGPGTLTVGTASISGGTSDCGLSGTQACFSITAPPAADSPACAPKMPLTSGQFCYYGATFTAPGTPLSTRAATLNINNSSPAGAATQTVALSGESK